MASVIFYFQVHQPWRLRRYSVFDADPNYFEGAANGEICEKVAEKCYRPTTQLILDLVKKHEGNFRVSYAITGTVLDQFKRYCPDVVDLFVQLAESGCCEFVGETYYHSLSFIYSPSEFEQQVDAHTRTIQELFGQTPTVFRNTELIYHNEVSRALAGMRNGDGSARFLGCLCEGVDRHLGYRSPNYVYTPPHYDDVFSRDREKPFGLLLKNYKLSDDIAFRFSNRAWEEWPLTAEKFAGWVHNINGDGYVCNLFMDYETFGEHQWADTGVFNFLSKLPEKLFDHAPGENHFITPSEAFRRFDAVGEYDVPEFISWADTERDLTAWRGNAMQWNALEETYRLEKQVKGKLEEVASSGEAERLARAEAVLSDWRKLTTSDHFYYMCTKFWADGDVHKYFSPYDSPYDGYINFMNVLDNVRTRLATV
ncbi:MAG: alpha-amylase [Planctomycetota bacterium]